MTKKPAVQPDFECANRKAEARTVLALIGAFWLASAILSFSYQVVSATSEGSIVRALAREFLGWITMPGQVPAILIGCAICWALYVVVVPVSLLPVWKQIFAASLLTIAAAALFSAFVAIVLGALGPEPDILRPALMRAIRSLAPFGLWCGIMLTLTHNRRVYEREARLSFFEARAREAEMAALRYQVNPHLLYNTLNSIAALILNRRNDVAEAMVLKLSDFFRASLAPHPHGDSTLGEEIALQRLYLDIEQMRFPNLSSSFKVETGLRNALVPSLLLQPLIENAVKHGVRPDGLPTHVEVTAYSADECLTIVVADTGPGCSTRRGTGIGLANVRERLSARFGSQASLESHGAPGEGFRVTITTPLLFHE